MAEVHLCIQCNIIVTRRQHAVMCDRCRGWNHRKCGTGISHKRYLELNRLDSSFDWMCSGCDDRDFVDEIDSSNELTDIQQCTNHNSTYIIDNQSAPPMEVEISPLRPNECTRHEEMGVNSSTIPDESFDARVEPEINHQPAPHDVSIPDRPLTKDVDPEVPVTYEVVESGTIRKGKKLISSDGYTFNIARVTNERTYWRCSQRNKPFMCTASVKQFKDSFFPGLSSHVHPPNPGAAKKVKITKKVKEIANQRVFESAAAITERIMKEMLTDDDVNLPNLNLIARAANDGRKRLRPTETRREEHCSY